MKLFKNKYVERVQGYCGSFVHGLSPIVGHCNVMSEGPSSPLSSHEQSDRIYRPKDVRSSNANIIKKMVRTLQTCFKIVFSFVFFLSTVPVSARDLSHSQRTFYPTSTGKSIRRCLFPPIFCTSFLTPFGYLANGFKQSLFSSINGGFSI